MCWTVHTQSVTLNTQDTSAVDTPYTNWVGPQSGYQVINSLQFLLFTELILTLLQFTLYQTLSHGPTQQKHPGLVSGHPGASSLDYNFRRMRSSTAIPQSSSSTFYIDTPPLDVPFKLGDKLRQPTVQTTMAASHSPKLSRRKPRSETVSVLDSNKSSWVTRYQPGVLLLSGSMRECLIQRKLQESENEFCEQKKLKWVNNLVPRLWPHPVSVRGIHCWRILCVQCNRLCVNCSTHS